MVMSDDGSLAKISLIVLSVPKALSDSMINYFPMSAGILPFKPLAKTEVVKNAPKRINIIFRFIKSSHKKSIRLFQQSIDFLRRSVM